MTDRTLEEELALFTAWLKTDGYSPRTVISYIGYVRAILTRTGGVVDAAKAAEAIASYRGTTQGPASSAWQAYTKFLSLAGAAIESEAKAAGMNAPLSPEQALLLVEKLRGWASTPRSTPAAIELARLSSKYNARYAWAVTLVRYVNRPRKSPGDVSGVYRTIPKFPLYVTYLRWKTLTPIAPNIAGFLVPHFLPMQYGPPLAVPGTPLYKAIEIAWEFDGWSTREEAAEAPVFADGPRSFAPLDVAEFDKACKVNGWYSNPMDPGEPPPAQAPTIPLQLVGGQT